MLRSFRFFQLVAGPIERTNNLQPQIKARHEFDYAEATYGMKLMTWGFFKKLAIAGVLAIYVDRVFNDVSQLSWFFASIGNFLLYGSNLLQFLDVPR